jgi:pyridoxamine 5'-phosphate oxidase family protein
MKTDYDTIIQPDAVPVDGNYFCVGGMNLLNTTKYRNVLKNNKVAFVVDEEAESGKAQSCLA